jgi:hypothetical protein
MGGNKKKKKSPSSGQGAEKQSNDDADVAARERERQTVKEAEIDLLFYLRTKYALLGKAEWWWLMDESLAEIDRRLATENYVVIDNFLPREATKTLRSEVQRAHEGGHLAPGVLAGGKAGDSTQYTMKDVRGDHVGWFNGDEPECAWQGWCTLNQVDPQLESAWFQSSPEPQM